MGTLDGKVAIVTGAGRGIGRGEARLLAAEGAKVVVNDLGVPSEGEGADTTPAQEVVDEITADGGEAAANYDDVASWSGAEALIRQAISEFGHLDILVNNAGILRDAMSFNMTEEQWDSVIRVHLKGHFAPCHHAAVHWRERSKAGEAVSGRIINTSSESGLFGNPGQANYAAAKAGIAAMTIVLARELQKYGVTVNAIAPRARTRMTLTVPGAETYMGSKEGELDVWDPKNVAPVVAFLATDAAAGVSGQVLFVWGEHVAVLGGWHPLEELTAGGKRWTVAELIANRDKLFAAAGGGAIPPMPPLGLTE